MSERAAGWSGLVALTGGAMALARSVAAVAVAEKEAAHQQAVYDAYLYLTDQSVGSDQP